MVDVEAAPWNHGGRTYFAASGTINPKVVVYCIGSQQKQGTVEEFFLQDLMSKIELSNNFMQKRKKISQILILTQARRLLG